MMILPFYSLTASIMLSSFAVAFARGPVDGQGDGSEVSRSTRMDLERRENGLSAGADIVDIFSCLWQNAPNISARFARPPIIPMYYCRSLDRCPQFVTSIE
jgi:hypothetical protein